MKSSHPVYEFGHFRLDTTEQVLFCAGVPVHLTLKAFAVLSILVEKSGHLVSKGELMREVWPDACVEEANLAQAIATLRKALGESCRRRQNHEYIETIARRGYRFVASVSVPDGTNFNELAAAIGKEDQEEITTLVPSKNIPISTDTIRFENRHAECDEAYHLYMRGCYYWNKYTVDGLKKGIDYFRHAIRIRPDYALAYVGLADGYYRLSNIYLPPKTGMPQAKTMVMKALTLDDTLVEAHTLLALIKLFYDREWLAAETEFRRAIELAPNAPLVHKRYGWALGMLGRFEDAITELNSRP